MMPSNYRTSHAVRLSILFSPVRLMLCVASIAWFVAATAVYLGDAKTAGWLGPLSVIPLLAFTAWTVATDMRHRRDDAGRSPTAADHRDDHP